MKNLSLQNQLRLMNGLSLAGMLLVIVFAMVNLNHLHKQFAAYQSTQTVEKSLIEIKATALSVSRADPILPDTAKQLTDADKRISLLIKNMAALPGNAAVHAALPKVTKNWAMYLKNFRSAVKIASTSPNDALQIPDVAYTMYMEPIVGSLDKLVDGNKAAEIASREKITADVKRILWVILIPLLLAGVIVTVMQTLFSSSLRSRIRNIASEVGHLHKGDLSRRLPVGNKDEIGQMAEAINNFIARFENILRDVHNSADQTQQTAHGISTMTHSVTSNAKTQSDKVFQVSSAIGQMGLTIREIASNAASASDAARQTMSLAHSGSESGQHTIKALHKIDETVGSSAHTMEELDAAIQRIGSVSKMIQDIAEQTNLLALNAAIEAARAGEHGRGFAVVADEVRKLSERTATSTADISKIVQSIQSSTSQATRAMNQARDEVGRGMRHGQDMGELLRKIEESVQIVTDMMSQIAAATEEQSAAGDHITQHIDSVATISASTAADIEQARNAMMQLANASKNLHDTVGQFNLAAAA